MPTAAGTSKSRSGLAAHRNPRSAHLVPSHSGNYEMGTWRREFFFILAKSPSERRERGENNVLAVAALTNECLRYAFDIR